MNLSEDELAAASQDSHDVVREAKDAGAWIFGGGLFSQTASIVATDGSVEEGPDPKTKVFIGGFSIIEVSTHEEALRWAAKLAAACRCAQEVREIAYDPES